MLQADCSHTTGCMEVGARVSGGRLTRMGPPDLFSGKGRGACL